MESDLKMEIFAYKWFHRLLLDKKMSHEYNATEVYRDECLAYPECMEASDCDYLYSAILFRGWLFEKLFLKEIQAHANEFRNSRLDFYNYILQTCNRFDLFDGLTIFERVFATCAFVLCLCFYCRDNKYTEITSSGYICWAMFFDEFIEEFYKQGGWTRLKIVAVSYKQPLELLMIKNKEEKSDITLIKIRKAMKSYSHFKKIGDIDHDVSISISWIKYFLYYLSNASSDSDIDQFTEESHSYEVKSYLEAEDLLKQLKYLCDPNGSEVIKFLRQMSPINSFENSMANPDINDKHENLQPEEKTIFESNLEQKTIVNLDFKLAKKLNTVEESGLCCRERDKSVSPLLAKKLNTKEMNGVCCSVPDKSASKVLAQKWNTEEMNGACCLASDKSVSPLSTKKLDLEEMNGVCCSTPDRSISPLLAKKLYSEEINGVSCLKSDKSASPLLDTPSKQNGSIKIGCLSKVGQKQERKEQEITGYFQSKRQELDTKSTTVENLFEVKLKKNTISATHLSLSGKSIEKENNNDIKKEKDEWKVNRDKKMNTTLIRPMSTTCNTDDKKNVNKVKNDAINEQDEWKVRKDSQKSKNLIGQISPKKKSFETEASPKTQINASKEQEEWKSKEKNLILIEGMNSGKKHNKIKCDTKHLKELKNNDASFIRGIPYKGKNANKENVKIRNSIREEQDDSQIKNFLRMLLVLGDTQGISFVKKTTRLQNKDFNE